MRCHYVYDKEAGKVLIPGCWGTALSNDIGDCSCPAYTTFEGFERKEFNEKVNELKKEIQGLEKEIFRLNRILKHIYKPKKIS